MLNLSDAYNGLFHGSPVGGLLEFAVPRGCRAARRRQRGFSLSLLRATGRSWSPIRAFHGHGSSTSSAHGVVQLKGDSPFKEQRDNRRGLKTREVAERSRFSLGVRLRLEKQAKFNKIFSFISLGFIYDCHIYRFNRNLKNYFHYSTNKNGNFYKK